MDHASRLYYRFYHSVDAVPELSGKILMQLFREDCDKYFASLTESPPSSKSSAKSSSTVSRTSKKSGASSSSVSWPKLFLSKEFGVTGYFKTHQKVTNSDKMKHHEFIKHLRQTYEGTPQWDEYVQWVRDNHPDGSTLTGDPPKFVAK